MGWPVVMEVPTVKVRRCCHARWRRARHSRPALVVFVAFGVGGMDW